MIAEHEIRTRYNKLVAFLDRVDNQIIDSLEMQDAYVHAIAQYEMLHWILEIPDEPHWGT